MKRLFRLPYVRKGREIIVKDHIVLWTDIANIRVLNRFNGRRIDLREINVGTEASTRIQF